MRHDTETFFDVVIIGGSYAGLAAAMSLGRSRRRTLIIDAGDPCNKSTPHSHNFLTNDGIPPHIIAARGKEQVLEYPTVEYLTGSVVDVSKTNSSFTTITDDGRSFISRRLLFATGLKDLLPAIDGFAECWGKSIVHCPYCHGYELRDMKTVVLAHGDLALDYIKLIRNLTSDLILLTNGPSTLPENHRDKILKKGIPIVEKAIARVNQYGGKIESVLFSDRTVQAATAMFWRPVSKQHCPLPERLGCELNEQGLIKVDVMQKTTVKGIYAAGDSSSWRSVSAAVASGSFAGAAINKELCEEDF